MPSIGDPRMQVHYLGQHTRQWAVDAEEHVGVSQPGHCGPAVCTNYVEECFGHNSASGEGHACHDKPSPVYDYSAHCPKATEAATTQKIWG